jgi:hypothetical protein
MTSTRLDDDSQPGEDAVGGQKKQTSSDT